MEKAVTFKSFFHQATGFQPYPFQERLANMENMPSLVSVPTGLGKTAGVILSWLWRRRFANGITRAYTPRRLVYCLPMRVLVEQTIQNAEKWLTRLGLSDVKGPAEPIRVFPLLGGEVENDWDIYPEREAILVGTQDMLLSRALNRGYAMSRFRWPIHFALLNNDCLWVMDEIQLMGNGLSTSAQLQAFRRLSGTVKPVKSIWMSATLRREWLDTVDFDADADAQGSLTLDEDDAAFAEVSQRLNAVKLIKRGGLASKDGKLEAGLVLEHHHPGTLTLIVVNTVRRAMAIHEALAKKKPAADLVLIHSRFRPPDRITALAKLLARPNEAGTIAVTTQVVEAGVDVSARTLITDLAPWSSVVQRCGRCNREGKEKSSQILWLDLDLAKKDMIAPYSQEDVLAARQKLETIDNAGPANLPQVDSTTVSGHIIRRKDIIELFDTTPDLAGADIDISRFIRDTDDHDVQVFWREIPDQGPSPNEPAPARNELCPVAIRDIVGVTGLEKWRWDHLDRIWTRPATVSPGQMIMLRAAAGCYSEDRGWTGNKKDLPKLLSTSRIPLEADGDDPRSETHWQTLAQHSDQVVQVLSRLLTTLELQSFAWEKALMSAARWHDAGKAHPVFQGALLEQAPAKNVAEIWAKTGTRGIRYERPGFRHELASALAMLNQGLPDLAVYLVAAHHGKVRLSIRSLPHETPPTGPETLFARGVWDGDELGPAELGGGISLPKTSLDLSYMQLGEGPKGDSWLARMLALRDSPQLGPYRLAFLEALVRVADWRGSANTEEE